MPGIAAIDIAIDAAHDAIEHFQNEDVPHALDVCDPPAAKLAQPALSAAAVLPARLSSSTMAAMTPDVLSMLIIEVSPWSSLAIEGFFSNHIERKNKVPP